MFTLTASGTGAMEAAVVNTLSPGDTVLSVSIGVFGDRLGQIAEAYGAHVIKFTTTWGTAADPNDVKKALDDNPNIKAVIVSNCYWMCSSAHISFGGLRPPQTPVSL